MPASLKQALADPFALGHPDVPWKLPEKLPPLADLQRGVAILEGQLGRVERKHAAYCVAKLVAGFNERLTREESALRLEVWLEACGDLPNDLWSMGTLELLRGWKRDDHFGRVPEAADLRAAVGRELRKRQEQLQRARDMLTAARKGAAAPDKPFTPEPEEQRLQGIIDRALKHQHSFLGPTLMAGAKSAERRLAEIQNREPADWAREEVRPAPPKPDPIGMQRPGAAMAGKLAELAANTPRAQASKQWLADAARAHREGLPKPPLPSEEWQDEPMGEVA